MCINLSQSPCCSWMEKDTSTKPWVSEFPDERHLTENDPLPIQFSKVTSTHFYPVSYNAHLHCTNTTAVVLLFSFQTCFFLQFLAVTVTILLMFFTPAPLFTEKKAEVKPSVSCHISL